MVFASGTFASYYFGVQELTVDAVRGVLSRLRFTGSSESDVQEIMDIAFERAFTGSYKREHHLGASGRPDFFFPSLGLVVEVKVGKSGGGATRVWTQISNYAKHDSVRQILFATVSRKSAQVLPPVVGGVPVSFVILNSAF